MTGTDYYGGVVDGSVVGNGYVGGVPVENSWTPRGEYVVPGSGFTSPPAPMGTATPMERVESEQ